MRKYTLIILALMSLSLAIAACSDSGSQKTGDSKLDVSKSDDSKQGASRQGASKQGASKLDSEFLTKHWLRPLPTQGKAPASYTEQEQSLFPKDCGACHVPQYQDWQGSHHSLAMGAGLMGQLLDFDPSDSASQQDCLHCHAPLAEQALALQEQLVEVSLGAFDIKNIGNESKGLHEYGMTCAACHMRGYNIYGPPRNTGLPPLDTNKVIPHNGFSEEADFESSKFCGACHQFEQDGFRINGKLVENTLAEWQSSRYATEGMTCQKCHMPERRHLWKGIHDVEMTRSGVTIEASNHLLSHDTLSVTLTLTNTNTGHNFPTYLTPKVYLQAYQIDRHGDIISGTFQQETIGWEVSSTLTEEYFDTRIAPDSSHSLHYRAPIDSLAVDLTLRVMVDPDNFYRGFYEAKLDGGYTNIGTEQIQQAHAASQKSFYPLFESIKQINR